MKKPNQFRSSNFYMETGDILHMRFKGETGTTPTIVVNVENPDGTTNEETVPGQGIALDATDITSSGFTANWNFIVNATGYYLYVATDSAFTSPVVGYNGLDVGGVSTYNVTLLSSETDYYWKITPYNDYGSGESSSTGTITTDSLDDWFLPSINAVTLMHDNLHNFGLGNFSSVTSTAYWSSTESTSHNAYYYNFFAAGSVATFGKEALYRIRPIRSFIDALGGYNVRDFGPGGGYVFYKDGTTCYEAHKEDISAGYVWSNITTVAIGSTSNLINESLNNTTEIIAQIGHTNSAAKLCNDL